MKMAQWAAQSESSSPTMAASSYLRDVADQLYEAVLATARCPFPAVTSQTDLVQISYRNAVRLLAGVENGKKAAPP